MAHWWDERQLRILVLASLSAQYFITFFAVVRKFHIPPWLRSLLRLAHISSDALALFALATLFNRQKNGPGCRYAHGSRDLELLWAPIVLMHLGGQIVITSYKIGDNEQWSRHILTSLSKVTVALYVFYKSWASNDKRLFAATIVLFIMVIVRCLDKALNLKKSSFSALREASSSKANALPKASSSDASVFWGASITENRFDIHMFIDETRKAVHHAAPYPCQQIETSLTYQLFSDFPYQYSDRIEIVRTFLRCDPKPAYDAIQDALSLMTSFLYIKDNTATPYFDYKKYINHSEKIPYGRWFILLLFTALVPTPSLIAAICLVHTSSSKDAYSGEDTRVTRVLLYGTLVLELVYIHMQVHSAREAIEKVPRGVFQHNLIGLLARNKWHSTLTRIAGWLHCKHLVDEYFLHMQPIISCEEITELVRLHVHSWWKEDIVGAKSYRRINDTRGEWTLRSKGCFQRLGWSIRRPFDESVIVWHLATDLCFHHPAIAGDLECARQCKEMSNYMMHLLFENPEMLMPGSRKSLFTRAYDELKDILKNEKTSKDDREYTRRLIEICGAHPTPDSFGDTDSNADSIIVNAWVLAKGLLGDHHGDTTKMWEVIRGVWVEMLCFSAGRCRGYLHAEALGTGEEFLSYVWVLLAYSGMETFPEKLQRMEGLSVDLDESPIQHGREDIAAATTLASESEGSGHVVLHVSG